MTPGYRDRSSGLTLALTSPAFSHQQVIPKKYTCEGEDISPPLQWSGIPEGTLSLILIVDDPDAPDPGAPKMTWVHWLLYNLPVASSGLSENIKPSHLPDGTREGINNWNRTGYGGPCPPIGSHRYFFRLYALDTLLPYLDTPDKATLLHAMQGHVLAEAVLMGTYEKSS